MTPLSSSMLALMATFAVATPSTAPGGTRPVGAPGAVQDLSNKEGVKPVGAAGGSGQVKADATASGSDSHVARNVVIGIVATAVAAAGAAGASQVTKKK